MPPAIQPAVSAPAVTVSEANLPTFGGSDLVTRSWALTPAMAERFGQELLSAGVRITPEQLRAVINKIPTLTTAATTPTELGNQFVALLNQEGVTLSLSQRTGFLEATVPRPPPGEERGRLLIDRIRWMNEPRANPILTNNEFGNIALKTGSTTLNDLSDEEFRTMVAGLNPTARATLSPTPMKLFCDE